MPAKLMTAIFFDAAGKAYKYHNIPDTIPGRAKFSVFAKKKGGVYINWYDKKTRAFEMQEKLQ